MNRGKIKAVLTGVASLTAITAVAVGLTGCSNNGKKETITFINHKTDFKQDGTWDRYVKEFQKTHPNIEVKVQALNDYATNMKTRMNSNNYGDVFMLPDSVNAKDYSHFVEPFGKLSTLSKKYYGVNAKQYHGTVYGLPSDMNGQGMVVNMEVFRKAGYKTFPKTPEKFIAALKAIKAKEKGVTPLYTNYHSGWALSNWDYQVSAAAGDPNYLNEMMKMKSPFAKGKPMNTIYNILYTACKDKLVEGDPTTSDWEQCKQDMADNKIGAMELGSFAVLQVQQKNKKNANNIKFEAFPMTPKNGQQMVTIGADYCYAISKHSKHKKAAREFVDWLVNKSDYAKDCGAIPTPKGKTMPAIFDSLKQNNVKLVQNTQAPKGEEDLLQRVNNDAEVGFQTTEDYKQKIIDAGVGNNKESFESIMNEMNSRWNKAVVKNVK